MAILKLNFSNPEVSRTTTPYSTLESAVSASDTTSTLLNASGFDDAYFIMLGEPNGEETELVSITSISGNEITHPALSFDHVASTPVYCVAYDQIKVYRKRGETQSLIATINIQFGSSSNSTEFYGDAEAGDEFASSYYNSETEAETSKSEWVSMNGYADNSKYGMVIRASMLFQDKDKKVIKDENWFTWQHEGISQLVRKAQDKDKGWMLSGPTITTEATELDHYDATSFPLESDCRVLKQVWVKYTGDYKQAYPEDIQDGVPSDNYSESSPVWAFDGDDVVVRPGGATAMRTRYYPVVSKLVDNADIPARPIADYDHVIVNYMLMRAFEYARNEDMMVYYERRWEKGVGEMLDEIDKRQRDRPRKIMHPNPLYALTRDGGSAI